MEKSKSLPAFVLNTLRQRKYGLTALAGMLGSFVLYSFISGFWLVPGINFGVVREVAIEWFDIAYVLLVSVFAGLLLAFLKYKADDLKTNSRLAGIGGAAAGFLAATCPACQAVSLTALGTTFFSLPLSPIIPYLWVFRIASLFILGFAAYLTADSAYTKTCKPILKVNI
ncbi:MAG: hypothetical protein HY438_03215 [DPANN group archaeon]|nr:hypothetical protein [DPANN group archaeon]